MLQVTTQNLLCVRISVARVKASSKGGPNLGNGQPEKHRWLAKQYKAKGGGYK